MIQLKLFKYSASNETNGYRGEEFSDYILEGVENVEDISQTLDTSEITLQGLTRKKAFDPETKFVVDIWQDGERVQTLHRVVNIDSVEQVAMNNTTYYKHSISFYDPSVIAQKRVCDNIAVTYKLKDVNLETHTTFDPLTERTVTNDPTVPIPSEQWHNGVVESESIYTKYRFSWGKYFQWQPAPSYGEKPVITFQNQDGTTTNTQYRYQDLDTFNTAGEGETPVYKAKFILPKPQIMFSDYYRQYRSYYFIGYASMRWTITETDPNDNSIVVATGVKLSNSNLYQEGSGIGIYPTYPYVRYFSNISNDLKRQWLCEEARLDIGPQYIYNQEFCFYFKRYTDTANGIDFSQTLYSDLITVKPTYKYTLTCEIYNFDSNLPSYESGNFVYTYTGNTPIRFCEYYSWEYNNPRNNTFQHVSSQNIYNGQTSCSTFVEAYTTTTIRETLSHGVPYSVLNLIRKAILNSQNGAKQDSIASYDINHTDSDDIYDFNCPFYIDPSFAYELSTTQVVENFYNQKNLWEILLEAGYYIHAIPRIEFGNNDKFKITFDRLGETTQYEDSATPQSIINFRGIDDYICSTTSYIENLVQLGGKIEEWVTPQTESADYIISNDTACIKTSKKIIELLKIEVKCNSSSYTGIGITLNAVANLTDYIYEKNVYDLLSYNYLDEPNKGIAMYYELGTNVIKGGDYQLPQSSHTIYSDYAFKKIIYCAFHSSYPTPTPIPTSGYWTDIKVNDFSFKVVYRTKDTTRETHTRPDLRKYLLNSKFDKYPMHVQFNNQEDTLVDSYKLGMNLYGKLLRTGNLNYKVNEWVESLGDLKRKGQLYTIDNELYYVAKVTNTYYTNHIISEVEFSKDYNQLSQVVGIPSEPRFYEISEQSSIKREVAIEDFLILTLTDTNIDKENGYLNNLSHLKNLIFENDGTTDFAKYVVTTFKGDKDMGTEEGNFGVATHYKSIVSPINAYSSGTTLTYEWDTVDNFSAGNKVSSTGTSPDIADSAYNTLVAVQYPDKYGKATLFDFYILEDIANLSFTEIKELPESPINTLNPVGAPRPMNALTPLATNVKVPLTSTTAHDSGEILLKDCREIISINYNLQLITNSDQFVISPFFFLPNKKNCKIVFLSNEVNKFNNGYINTNEIINMYNVAATSTTRFFDLTIDDTSSWVNGWGQTVVYKLVVSFSLIWNMVNPSHFEGQAGVTQVKSIAIICDADIDGGDNPTTQQGTSKFICARNISSPTTKMAALTHWQLGTPSKDLFSNKQ